MPCVSRLLVVLAIPFLALSATAADPNPIEKQLAVQKAMATARQFLELRMPDDAILALEAEVANADGNKAFLTLMREAYLAQLYRLENAADPDAAKVEKVRRKLALLGGAVPVSKPEGKGETPAPPRPATTPDQVARPAGSDHVAEAVAAFNKGEWANAAKLFGSASTLTTDQKAAWGYCRIRLAADRINSPSCDPDSAAAIVADLTEALKLVPDHAELQKVGETILAAARAKATAAPLGSSGAESADVVETANFRVQHSGRREVAEAVAKAAEANRTTIFQRWSGPPAGPWTMKCQIVVHPTAEAYAKATGRPAASTGTSRVKLSSGRATERRIDLRADDAAITSNALPRELTHVVLADLFPDKPAPKWAVEAMAILAGDPDEVDRYVRTLPRCARDGDWFALAQLLEMKDFPAEKITGFYCQSVSLAEYLIRAGGTEQNFTIFLRDCQRYGTASALKRTYGVETPQALEAAWKRAALEASRGQMR